MTRRNIPEAVTREIISNADQVLERDDGCIEYTGVWQGRTILVVVCGEAEPYRVVTVFDKTRGRR
jgi:hypothetical protein